jgi:peptide/nickel transport system substrate-binding protein
MRKWLAIPLVLIIAVTMILASCGKSETTTVINPTPTATQPIQTTTQPTQTTVVPTATEKVAPWGTIVTALTDFGVESLDPNLYNSNWGWSLYDNLINTNDAGTYIPWIATSWSTSVDGLTWTFKIRDDVYFSNGDKLTSADVMFSMTRFASTDSQSPWSSGLRANLASMSAPDATTFIFVCQKPELPLISTFAATSILPKNYFESVGSDGFRLAPVGSGAWKFVSHVAQTNFVMEANENYWDPANIPVYKYVKEIQVPEEATQIAMFKNGEVDIPTGITVSSRVQLQREGYRLQPLGLNAPIVLNMQGTNVETAAVGNFDVRMAMSYAINRQELCDTIYEGQAVPGGLFALQPGGFGATTDLVAMGADPYNTAKAKELLAKANYPDAFTNPKITLITTAGPALDLLQAIQAYWVAVGLQVEIKTMETSTLFSYIFNAKTPLTAASPNVGYLWAWTFGAADSTYMQKNLLCSYGVHGCLNDPAVDKLYEDFLANTDISKSLDMFVAFLRAGNAHRGTIGICMTLPLIAVSDKLGEFTTHLTQYYANAYSGIKHPIGAKPTAKDYLKP